MQNDKDENQAQVCGNKKTRSYDCNGLNIVHKVKQFFLLIIFRILNLKRKTKF